MSHTEGRHGLRGRRSLGPKGVAVWTARSRWYAGTERAGGVPKTWVDCAAVNELRRRGGIARRVVCCYVRN